jgi:hypothetical protein
MISALFAVSVILMQAAPSASPASPAPPASTTVSPLTVRPEVPITKRHEVDPKAVVCHDELPIGSRFAKKVCASNEAFAERTRQDQEMVREWKATPISSSSR